MEKFAIVNLKGGQRRDVESFLLDNDSFPILENAYLFRGRIEKRSGTTPVGPDGRLKGSLGNTGASPFAVTLLDGTVSGGIPVGIASFRIGTVLLTDPGGASPVNLISTDPAYTGTLNRATGALSIAHPGIAVTPVIYVPGLPAMGLKTLEQEAINEEFLMSFDTRYTYLFNEGTGDFQFQRTFRGAVDVFVWTGTNSDFFWTCNYFKAFWATNYVAGFHASVKASTVAEKDGIRWYVSDATGTGWANFNPAITAANFLIGALIILPYKGRLVVLNTLEGPDLANTVRFLQRARWSWVGTPFYDAASHPDGTGSDAAAWRSDQVGKGGFIDAPTQEAIVSAEFIKDTLIVYFERSTWQLVYTGNETLPLVWQKINTELGTESTHSVVPFDRGVFGIGNYGIITTDSVNVARIDEKIPDQVFQIQNINNGTKRVYGVRDFNAQLVYWSYPIVSELDNEAPSYVLTYPNQVLVYNYLFGSWSQFDDSFTCFGYWQKKTDETWSSLVRPWADVHNAWNSAVLQARYPDVVAGNQRGYVMVFSQLQMIGQNAPSLPISNLTTTTHALFCPDHNLIQNQYVLLTGVQGVTGVNSLIYKVLSTPDKDNILLDRNNPGDPSMYTPWVGTYTGGGSVTFIPNFYIQTKEFNPWYEQGQSIKAAQIDVFTDNTSSGSFIAELFVSDNTSLPVSSLVVTTVPETAFSLSQNKSWHRLFTNYFGSFVQIGFTMNDEQMRSLTITGSDITIHGIIFYVDAGGRLTYEFQ